MTDCNRCDIVVGEHTVTAQVAGQPILFKHRGQDWTIGEGADLGAIILAACTLLDFERGRSNER
jgi:hypothetical protein